MVAKNKLLRMDNVLIVVDDLEAAKAFFAELGMELEGETTVEGPSVGSLIGLKDVRATLALMRTPDGHGRIELDKFHTPNAIRFGPVDAPVNTLGIRRVTSQNGTRVRQATKACPASWMQSRRLHGGHTCTNIRRSSIASLSLIVQAAAD